MEGFDVFRDSEGRSYHIRAKKGELSGFIITVGSPERAELASRLLDNSRLISSNRGLLTYLGSYKGIDVTVFCSGMGPGSAEIALTEALANVNYSRFRSVNVIRVGTAGSWNPGVKVGDIVAETGIVRNEGSTLKIAPLEWPARSSPLLLLSIAEAASRLGVSDDVHFGPGITKDTLYADESPEERSAVPWEVEARGRAYETMGALATSMESSVMAILSELYGSMLKEKGVRFRFASALLIVSPYQGHEGKGVTFSKGVPDEEKALRLGLEALRVISEMEDSLSSGRRMDLWGGISVMLKRLTY